MSTSTSSTRVEMPSGYQIPSYFCLLKNFDSIYASGMFCHVAKVGRKRDQQLRLIWAVEQMLGELQKVREENLQLRSPFFHAKRSAKRKISAQFKPAEEEIPLDDRLARETRLYKEARERLKRGKPLRFVPDYDHLTRAHRQLSGSLQFFHIGIHWMGMPRWRKPYLDFEWAPPPPTSLPSTKTVECVSGLDARVMIEMPRTPELMRADSDRPSIADSEATLVADTPMDTGDDELCKGPPESSRSARSFSLIQSFYSFISDPGNPLASF